MTQEIYFLTPIKRYIASRVHVNVDSFDKEVIRRTIHSFYDRREYPTLTKILEALREKEVFQGGRFCLWRIIQEIGFTYKKRDSKRYIYEQHNIIEQRHTYLQTIKKLRRENKTIIYTDETWVNAHHTQEYIWVDSDGRGGWKVPSLKGQRLIVVHAGGVEGWVPGANLFFRSKTNSIDYHDEMNSEHFMEWFTQQLLPNIPNSSVIVLDNATYHNKQKDKAPTTANRKDDLKQWLDRYNIQYDDKDIKKTLLEKVKQHRPTPLYLTDEAAHRHGHTVLRLPVAHCELNPIGLAWASVKGYVAKHNTKFSLKDIEQLTADGFTHTTTDMWRGFCRHVVDIENNYFEKDGLIEDRIEEMIIEFGDDDSDDDDDDEYEDEDGMIDADDRQLIDEALQQAPGPTDTYTNPRNLTSILQSMDPEFLSSVLPLP